MMTKVVDGERVELSDKEKESINKIREESETTQSEVEVEKIQEIKEKANKVLSETDWYVVRKQETAESIPQSVIDHRVKVRSLSDQFENDVLALSSVSEIENYSFAFPEPPEP